MIPVPKVQANDCNAGFHGIRIGPNDAIPHKPAHRTAEKLNVPGVTTSQARRAHTSVLYSALRQPGVSHEANTAPYRPHRNGCTKPTISEFVEEYIAHSCQQRLTEARCMCLQRRGLTSQKRREIQFDALTIPQGESNPHQYNNLYTRAKHSGCRLPRI